jgi:hypothetical protein
VANLVKGIPPIAHSWIVLENTVTGMQVCIDYDAGYLWHGSIIVSLNGEFGAALSGGTGVDGTINGRPTAADEVIMVDGSYFAINALYTSKLHVLHSTDGECTMAVLCYNNKVAHCWVLGMPSVPITGWTGPIAGVELSTNWTTSQATYAIWNDAANVVGQIGGDNISCYMTCEGCVGSMVGEQMTYQDDDTLEWPIMPIGLLCTAGAHRGRKGALYDLWWGSTDAGMGNTYPADASNQFVQFDHLIFPWNGSTPETA